MYFVDKRTIFVRFCESKSSDFESIDESTTSTNTTTKHESARICDKSITISKKSNEWQTIYNEKWDECAIARIEETNEKKIDWKVYDDQEEFCTS